MPSRKGIAKGTHGKASAKKTSQKVSGTGMGSEAAEGLHAVGGRSQSSPSAAASRETGRSKSDSGIDRAGSEPLSRQQQTHKGSYGGEGGKPRSSSDQRENVGARGASPEKPGNRPRSQLGDEEAGDGLGTQASEGGGEGSKPSRGRK
jgi:hypothetical protein